MDDSTVGEQRRPHGRDHDTIPQRQPVRRPWDNRGEDLDRQFHNGQTVHERDCSGHGFQYSELVEFPGDEYHLAFMAKSPITVLEGLKQNFSHSGAIAEIDDVIYVLCQLNPFSSSNRENEALIIKEKVEYYGASGKPVVVFGDFNSLSPQDGAAGFHKEYNCSCPNQSCEWACKDGKIDYDPVNIILSANLTDLCWFNPKVFTCQGSYPTEVYSQPYSAVRIDYIMANEAFLSKWESLYGGSNASAEVIKNNWTEHTSDHYPIQLVGPAPDNSMDL